MVRLIENGVRYERVLAFRDPDGLALELVTTTELETGPPADSELASTGPTVLGLHKYYAVGRTV